LPENSGDAIFLVEEVGTISRFSRNLVAKVHVARLLKDFDFELARSRKALISNHHFRTEDTLRVRARREHAVSVENLRPDAGPMLPPYSSNRKKHQFLPCFSRSSKGQLY
jgi:hypothetical protein